MPELSAQTVPPGPLVVHVDVDVIDAAELPGLRFPVAGGPSADDVLAACRRLLATGRVVALDVACTWFSPADTRHEQLAARLADLAREQPEAI